MRRFFLFLILFFFIFFVGWFFGGKFFRPTLIEKEKENKVQLEPPTQGMKKINFEGKDFFFLYQQIEKPENLQLLPNFEEKFESTDLFQKNQCQFLTNAGFYDKEDQPLGWFFTQNKLLRKEIKSNLFNGFLFKNEENKVFIDQNLPLQKVIWGLQSGPLLVWDNQALKIKINNDERARRIVAALDENDKLFFLVITGSESLFSGPFLKDLPLIVKTISKILNKEFKNAINLDGGTASAFLNQEKTIKEYAPIGSFFCLY